LAIYSIIEKAMSPSDMGTIQARLCAAHMIGLQMVSTSVGAGGVSNVPILYCDSAMENATGCEAGRWRSMVGA